MAGDETLHSVMQMSDEELFEKLREHGFDVGPIVDSTRSVYQKKLVQILEGGYVALPDYGDSDEDENDVERHHSDSQHLSDHEDSFRHRVQQHSPPRPASGSPRPDFDISRSPYTVTARPELSSFSAKQSRYTDVSQTPPKSSSQEKTSERQASTFPKTILIAIAVVVLCLAFLLYQNMEASQDSNPVPKIDGN